MPAKSKQRWSVGDLFFIPLKDGAACLAQVIGREPSILNSVAVALVDAQGDWSEQSPIPTLKPQDVFAVLLVTRELLDSGRWRVMAGGGSSAPVTAVPYEDLRAKGHVGAKVRGAGNVEEFVNAFFGLMPWDDWYVPNYLDDFLVSLDKKPHHRLVYSGRHGNPVT